MKTPQRELERVSEVLTSFGRDGLAQEKLGREKLSELLMYLAEDTKISLEDLIFLGADPDYVDDEGATCISHAIQSSAKGRDPVVTIIRLLAVGADPNQTYLSAYRVAGLALSFNQPGAVIALILAGAELDVEDDSGMSLRGQLRASEYHWARNLEAVIGKRKRPSSG